MAIGTHSKGFLSDINVTPFVDVMLVLLIIFMVTAPMLTQGLEVDLPSTRSVAALPTDSENMILTIAADRSMLLDEYAVSLEDLEIQLRTNVTNQGRQLFLKADESVPYGFVVKVMGEIRAAGVERLGVVAEQDTSLNTQTPSPDAGEQGQGN